MPIQKHPPPPCFYDRTWNGVYADRHVGEVVEALAKHVGGRLGVVPPGDHEADVDAAVECCLPKRVVNHRTYQLSGSGDGSEEEESGD